MRVTDATIENRQRLVKIATAVKVAKKTSVVEEPAPVV